jgi:hypothetical protein
MQLDALSSMDFEQWCRRVLLRAALVLVFRRAAYTLFCFYLSKRHRMIRPKKSTFEREKISRFL